MSSNEPSDNNALLKEHAEETVSSSQITEEAAGDATEYETGHIPVPMKVPETYYPEGVEEPAGNIANKYLPDINTEITPVKNQGQEGLCWAFTAAAVLEQSAIKTRIGDLSTDYDEHQLNVGFSSNHKNDPLNLTAGDKAVKTTEGNNNLFTTWLLASQVSPVSQNTPDTAGYSERAASLVEAKFIPSNEIDAIKQAILDYGAVSLGIDSTNYNGSINKLTYGYRAKSQYKENHEVTLIGWDDTIDKSTFGAKKGDKNSEAVYGTCPRDGGFKFKNSWGTNVGEEGYQYISYEDYAFSGEDTYAIAYKIDSSDTFDTVYEYDGSYGIRSEYVTKAANFYTANGNDSENGAEVINKAGFGVYDTGEYVVSIYLNNNKDELTNATSGQWFMDDENLIASKKVTASNAGYYTAEFDEPPQIEEGMEFAVVLKKTDSSLFGIYTDKTYINGNWMTFTANTANEKKFVQNNFSYVDSSSFTPRLKVFTKNVSTIPAVPTDLSTANVTLSKYKFNYTGSGIEPRVMVKDENGTVVKMSDNYIVSYSDNINAGTGKVKIMAKDGGLCSGLRELTFTIDPVSLAGCQVTGVTSKTYTGSSIEQEDMVVKLDGKTLSENRDYSLSYTGNTNVGNNAQVKVKGKGNYSGEKAVSFSITKATPVLSNIKATSILTGQTLASSVVSGTAKNGSVTVWGRFEFKNPDVKPSKGTRIYDVIFTPNDQKNYENAAGKASVSVVDPIPVDSVSLNSYDIILKTGATYKLTAKVIPANATVQSITWESSNISVAKVDQYGVVTAVSYGKANISAVCDGVRSQYCTVSVTDDRIPVTSVYLNKTSISLEKEETETLTVSILPENATVKTLKWISSNPAVAIVSGNGYGIVTALSKGTTDITAVCDGITSNTCRVTVNTSGEDTPEVPDKPVVPDIPDVPVSGNTPPALGTNIKANTNTDIYLVKGQKYTLDAGYVWTSSDPSIVSVAGKYRITARSRGETEIKNNDGKIIFTAHVTDPGLSLKKMTLQSGAQAQLEFKNLDNSEKYGVYWYSSNPEVARVKDGLVYAAGKGNTTIKVYLNGKTFTCNVKVVETSGITASTDNKYVFKPLQSAKIPAKGFKYSNATWTSSTPLKAVVGSGDNVTGWKNDIVYIAKNGKITAIGQGTTDIRVKDTNGKELSFSVTVTKPQTHVAFVNVSRSKSWSFYNVKMNKVVWKSSDSSIANIYNGKITAGMVTGIATVSGNYDPYATGRGFDYTMKVYVEDPRWNADRLIAVSPSKYIMTAAQNKDYKIDSTGIYQSVVFKSSNDAVACIDEYGYLHTGKAGKANITTKINGKTYIVKVNVE